VKNEEYKMNFYERSENAGVWFLRNDKGHLLSPHFTHFNDLMNWVAENKEYGVDTERELAFES